MPRGLLGERCACLSLVDNSETPDNVELHYRRVVLAQCLVGSWDLGFLRKSNFVNGIRILKQSYFVQQEMQLDCFGNVLVVPGYRFCCCEGLSRKSSSKRCLSVQGSQIVIGDLFSEREWTCVVLCKDINGLTIGLVAPMND